MNKALKIYVAGKVSKDSTFGTHYWRDEFVQRLQELSGMALVSLDPAKKEADQNNYEESFGGDVLMISKADIIVVYLSDDISVGGSQEILVAKYFDKPVIGLAPIGGKFHSTNKEIFGQKVKDYKHPFVFATCDVVRDDIEGVADSIKNISDIKIKTLEIIKALADKYEADNLPNDEYMKQVL